MPSCPGTITDRSTGEHICLLDGHVCDYDGEPDECPRPGAWATYERQMELVGDCRRDEEVAA